MQPGALSQLSWNSESPLSPVRLTLHFAARLVSFCPVPRLTTAANLVPPLSIQTLAMALPLRRGADQRYFPQRRPYDPCHPSYNSKRALVSVSCRIWLRMTALRVHRRLQTLPPCRQATSL